MHIARITMRIIGHVDGLFDRLNESRPNHRIGHDVEADLQVWVRPHRPENVIEIDANGSSHAAAQYRDRTWHAADTQRDG